MLRDFRGTIVAQNGSQRLGAWRTMRVIELIGVRRYFVTVALLASFALGQPAALAIRYSPHSATAVQRRSL